MPETPNDSNKSPFADIPLDQHCKVCHGRFDCDLEKLNDPVNRLPVLCPGCRGNCNTCVSCLRSCQASILEIKGRLPKKVLCTFCQTTKLCPESPPIAYQLVELLQWLRKNMGQTDEPPSDDDNQVNVGPRERLIDIVSVRKAAQAEEERSDDEESRPPPRRVTRSTAAAARDENDSTRTHGAGDTVEPPLPKAVAPRPDPPSRPLTRIQTSSRPRRAVATNHSSDSEHGSMASTTRPQKKRSPAQSSGRRVSPAVAAAAATACSSPDIIDLTLDSSDDDADSRDHQHARRLAMLPEKTKGKAMPRKKQHRSTSHRARRTGTPTSEGSRKDQTKARRLPSPREDSIVDYYAKRIDFQPTKKPRKEDPLHLHPKARNFPAHLTRTAALDIWEANEMPGLMSSDSDDEDSYWNKKPAAIDTTRNSPDVHPGPVPRDTASKAPPVVRNSSRNIGPKDPSRPDDAELVTPSKKVNQGTLSEATERQAATKTATVKPSDSVSRAARSAASTVPKAAVMPNEPVSRATRNAASAAPKKGTQPRKQRAVTKRAPVSVPKASKSRRTAAETKKTVNQGTATCNPLELSKEKRDAALKRLSKMRTKYSWDQRMQRMSSFYDIDAWALLGECWASWLVKEGFLIAPAFIVPPEIEDANEAVDLFLQSFESIAGWCRKKFSGDESMETGVRFSQAISSLRSFAGLSSKDMVSLATGPCNRFVPKDSTFFGVPEDGTLMLVSMRAVLASVSDPDVEEELWFEMQLWPEFWKSERVLMRRVDWMRRGPVLPRDESPAETFIKDRPINLIKTAQYFADSVPWRPRDTAVQGSENGDQVVGSSAEPPRNPMPPSSLIAAATEISNTTPRRQVSNPYPAPCYDEATHPYSLKPPPASAATPVAFKQCTTLATSSRLVR